MLRAVLGPAILVCHASCRPQLRRYGVSPERGAETMVFLATDPSVAGSREPCWKDCRPVTPSEYARRADEAARLWELSERLCGVTYPWHSANNPILPAGSHLDTGEPRSMIAIAESP